MTGAGSLVLAMLSLAGLAAPCWRRAAAGSGPGQAESRVTARDGTAGESGAVAIMSHHIMTRMMM